MSNQEPLKTRFTKYILWVTEKGLAIGIDRPSGGYPFETNSLDSMEKFNTKEEASRFKEICDTSNKWEIRELEVRIR
jgi:hypothetical protein